MKSLFETLQNKDIKELVKHPRFKLLDIALKRINQERQGTKYKPMTMKLLGIKTSLLSTDDLDYLIKVSQQSGNFSRLFFGLLKKK